MAARIRRQVPPYQQVADHLREQIIDGELSDGHFVPSERALMEQWQISCATATKALAALRSLGLVESKIGVGTVVRPLPPGWVDDGDVEDPPSPHERHAHMRSTGEIRYSNATSTILVAELRPAPADVRRVLHLDADEDAICRERVSRRHGTPVELCTSWFRRELQRPCPRLLTPERISEGTTRYLERRLDVSVARIRETDRAIAAGRHDGAHLQVDPTRPILTTRVEILTDHGTLAYEVYRYRGPRTRVHELPPP